MHKPPILQTILPLLALATACDVEKRAVAGTETRALEKTTTAPASNVEELSFEGPEHAPVTIIVALDYQCPYCRRQEETLERLRATFPREVRVAVRHLPLPFHAHAREAALALEAAREQGRFREMSSLLMNRQGEISPEKLGPWAAELGLDLPRFEADRRSKELAARVDGHIQAAKDAGAKGTPSTWINGKLIVGARPYAEFERALHEALGRPVPIRDDDPKAEPSRGCIPGDVECKPEGC